MSSSLQSGLCAAKKAAQEVLNGYNEEADALHKNQFYDAEAQMRTKAIGAHEVLKKINALLKNS